MGVSRSTPWRRAACGQACVRCGARDGTVVLAHYFGPRRHAYGGGLSRKGHDAIGAWLCRGCHALMDVRSRDKTKKWEHSEEFLHLCALTWLELLEQGVVAPTGAGKTVTSPR